MLHDTIYYSPKKHLAISIKAQATLDNIYKSPNTILDNILLKTQILFLTNHYFKKPKYYTWQDFIKSPKLLIFGKQLFHKNQNIIWKKILYYTQRPKLIKSGKKYIFLKKKKSYFKAKVNNLWQIKFPSKYISPWFKTIIYIILPISQNHLFHNTIHFSKIHDKHTLSPWRDMNICF